MCYVMTLGRSRGAGSLGQGYDAKVVMISCNIDNCETISVTVQITLPSILHRSRGMSTSLLYRCSEELVRATRVTIKYVFHKSKNRFSSLPKTKTSSKLQLFFSPKSTHTESILVTHYN